MRPLSAGKDSLPNKLLTGIILAALLTACQWDGYADEIRGEPNTSDNGRAVTSYEFTETPAEEISQSELTGAEAQAKEIILRWLELSAVGDAKAADELLTDELRSVNPEFRLFNSEYPGDADIYFVSFSDEADGSAVTVSVVAVPVNDPSAKGNAKIKVVFDGGEPLIDSFEEFGTNVIKLRSMNRRAKRLYIEARRIFDKYKPESRMHHMGEGSEFINELESIARPRGEENFSVAVKDGDILYVSWSIGKLNAKYP